MAIALRAAAADSEGTDTSAEVLMPSGATQDDILIACVNHSKLNTEPAAFSWPANWTVLNSGGGGGTANSSHFEVAWKKFNTGDGTQTVTLDSNNQGGWVSSCVAYSGVDLTTPVIANGIGSWSSATSSSTLTTPTATDSTADVWRVAIFQGVVAVADATWGSYSPADTERNDNSCTAATRRPNQALVDSNGTVDASAGTSVTATPTAGVNGRIAWIGLLNPAAAGSGAPAGNASVTSTANDATVSITWPSGISFIAAEGHTHGENTDFTINKPSGTAQNDIMITVVTAVGSGAGEPAFTMSDWTELDTETTTAGSDGRTSVYYRIAGSSDPSSWTGSRTQGGSTTACAVVTSTYRNIDTGNPFVGNNSAGAADPGTLSSGIVNSATATTWAIGCAGAIDNSASGLDRSAGAPIVNRGGVQSLDSGSAAGAGLWDSAGQTGTGDLSFTLSETGVTDWASSFIAVLRASTGAATNANAGHASVTVTAYSPDSRPIADTASATGTANAPAASVKALAGHAAASVTASDTTFDYAPAGHASASAAANNATVATAVSVLAGTATASSVAENATVATGISVQAGHASASVSTEAGLGGVAGLAGEVASTAVANSPSTKVSFAAGTATASAVAENATISTVVERNAPAGEVQTTAVANNASVLLKPSAGTATASSLADPGTASPSALAGHAAASGTADDTRFDYAPAGHASASTEAFAVTTTTGTFALAGHASVTVTANDTRFNYVPAEHASATGVANNATVLAGESGDAGHAAVSVTANNATVATSVDIPADFADIAATAHNATVKLGIAAGTAVVFGTAENGQGGTGPLAGHAPATGTAADDSTAVKANAELASVSVLARPVGVVNAEDVDADTATAVAVANDPTVRTMYLGGFKVKRPPPRRRW